jgi:hypothetical protein
MRRQRSSRGRPSKAALLKFFAAFSNHGDGIDRAANPATDIGQVRQDALQVGVSRSKLGCEQLVDKLVRLHAATARLSLKAIVGVGGDVDYPVARCHERSVGAQDPVSCASYAPVRSRNHRKQPAVTGFVLVRECGFRSGKPSWGGFRSCGPRPVGVRVPPPAIPSSAACRGGPQRRDDAGSVALLICQRTPGPNSNTSTRRDQLPVGWVVIRSLCSRLNVEQGAIGELATQLAGVLIDLRILDRGADQLSRIGWRPSTRASSAERLQAKHLKLAGTA